MKWDPQQYERYAAERAQPFTDLIARVDVAAPRRVVDLGCGPGTQTARLAQRWPQALVEGLDHSPDMIAAAQPLATDRLRFTLGDVADWEPPADADVVLSNATLQWVPGHADLLRRWAQALPPGGVLAFQVPANFDQPSHVLMRELAASPAWRDALDGVLRHHDAVASPQQYASLLLDAGLHVHAWATEYLHLLPGEDPVLDWLRGTGLRPVLAALNDTSDEPNDTSDESAADRFCAEFAARLRTAYPATPHGTFLPYRRVFVVASRSR